MTNFEENDNQEKKSKVKPSVVIYSGLAIIVILLALVIVSVYLAGFNNKLTDRIARALHFPAVVINYGESISLKDLDENLSSERRFYENQDFSKVGMRIDFTTSDGQKRLQIIEKGLLNKLVEDKAVEILAKKRGVVISKELADQSLKRKIEEYGAEDALKENISRLYGWNIENFKNKVVLPGLYSSELEKIINEENKENFSAESRKKIDAAYNELASSEFSAVAEKYSEGVTAGQGGELGWFNKSQLLNEISDAVFKLGKGEKSGIIESSLGFHIIEVEDKKTENNIDLVKIRQVFVRKKAFADWLADQMQQMKIFIPLKDFKWNSGTATVDFSEQSMRDYEKYIRDNFPGDASIIF